MIFFNIIESSDKIKFSSHSKTNALATSVEFNLVGLTCALGTGGAHFWVCLGGSWRHGLGVSVWSFHSSPVLLSGCFTPPCLSPSLSSCWDKIPYLHFKREKVYFGLGLQNFQYMVGDSDI